MYMVLHGLAAVLPHGYPNDFSKSIEQGRLAIYRLVTQGDLTAVRCY
jgi:hypothetical protein